MVLRRNSFRGGATIAAILALLCAGGCRLPNRVSLDDGGRVDYHRAMIAYQIDGTQRTLPLRADAVTTVAFTERDHSLPQSAKPEIGERDSIWKSAQLSIEYPHPDKLPGMARASLRLSAQPHLSKNAAGTGAKRSLASQILRTVGWNSASNPAVDREMYDDELWVLDLPKSQLDLLLGDLSAEGFFESQTRPPSGTHLDIRTNHGRMAKSWSPEPGLDHFVMRVYREGRLRGFVPSTAALKTADLEQR